MHIEWCGIEWHRDCALTGGQYFSALPECDRAITVYTTHRWQMLFGMSLLGFMSYYPTAVCPCLETFWFWDLACLFKALQWGWGGWYSSFLSRHLGERAQARSQENLPGTWSLQLCITATSLTDLSPSEIIRAKFPGCGTCLHFTWYKTVARVLIHLSLHKSFFSISFFRSTEFSPSNNFQCVLAKSVCPHLKMHMAFSSFNIYMASCLYIDR